MLRVLLVLFLIGAVASVGTSLTLESRPAVRIIVVYDNNRYDDRLQTDWGFSCYLEGLEKVILFDTGGNGRILTRNLEKLGLSPEKVEVVVLSHFHGDHTGGLPEILSRNSNIEVWVPDHFPENFKDRIRKTGARVVEVKEARQICHGVYTSGVIEGPIPEQSLILESELGLVVITGCAHPGIVKILKEVKRSFNREIYLVLGGLHLSGASGSEIESIISQLRYLEVKKVGPAHCSGDLARKLFAENFVEDFIRIGVGAAIAINLDKKR